MTSTLESKRPSPRVVKRAAVIRHGRGDVGPAAERLAALAGERGVELVEDPDALDVDIAVVLGGDGTMLRALARFMGTDVAVIGVNFGRVGFLASMEANELEAGLARVFGGDYRVEELTTLALELDGQRTTAVNDVVVHSAELGRMVELSWAVGGEDLGSVPCDGLICSTPTGSTAYNLSNGGPVLARGLDAIAVTFVAPHSLHARPLVVPRGLDLDVWNRTDGVPATVIVDGHAFADVAPAARATIRLGEQRCLLATLPEATFFRRYRAIFAH